MSVDINKIKLRIAEEEQKVAARSQRNTNWDFKYWSPKKGKNVIRLLPPWTTTGPNSGQFWREVFIHWNVGSAKSLPCPQKTPDGPKLTCPVCEEANRLRSTRDPMDSEMAGKLRAKPRYYSNIVDMDDPSYTDADVRDWKSRQKDSTRECPFKVGETKVQVYSYGPMVMKELLDVFADGTDLTDLQTGRNVIITHDGGDPPKYRSRPEFNMTVLNTSGPSIMTKLVDLDQIQPMKDVSVMALALNGEPMQNNALPNRGSGSNLSLRGGTGYNKPSEEDTDDFLADAIPNNKTNEEPPSCYKNPQIHSSSDPECVGGLKDGNIYDKCPFYDPCGQAVSEAKRTNNRRSAGTSATSTKDPFAFLEAGKLPNNAASLEAEMKQILKKR